METFINIMKLSVILPDGFSRLVSSNKSIFLLLNSSSDIRLLPALLKLRIRIEFYFCSTNRFHFFLNKHWVDTFSTLYFYLFLSSLIPFYLIFMALQQFELYMLQFASVRHETLNQFFHCLPPFSYFSLSRIFPSVVFVPNLSQIPLK